MFRLARKGFAALKRGCEIRHKAVAHGGQRDAWIIRFPVGRHCAIEIYVGGHTRAQSFAAERVGSDGGKPRGFWTCPKPIRRFRASANRAYPTSLWTLRINRLASLLLLSNSILRSAGQCTADHRVNEKSRIRFQIVRCNFNHNQDSCTIWHTNTRFYLYRNFILNLLPMKIRAKN